MQNSATHFSPIQKSYGLPGAPEAFGAGKAYGSSKALGGDPALAKWLDDATIYYKDVMSGQSPKPSPQEWNQFMGWMSWAKQSMMAGGQQWDPMVGNQGAAGPQKSNNYGGELGPNGSYVYDHVSTKVGFTGPDTRNDVFGVDNELSFDQASAEVSCEETTDHGVQVLKVLVKTSQGTAVYYYDNYKNPDFKLKLNVPFVDKVQGEEKFAGKIEVAKFDPNSGSDEFSGESSMKGVPDKNDSSKINYTPEKFGETIDFTFNPQGAGKTRTHVVKANANITTKPGDKSWDISMQSDGTVVVKVEHEDGSIDIVEVPKGYNVQLNGNVEYGTFNGSVPANGGSIPDNLAKRVKVPEVKGSSTSEDGGTDASDIIGKLLDKSTGTGKSEAQLISALNSAGYGPYKTIDQVQAAIEKGDIPGPMPKKGEAPQVSKFINFLSILDDEFSDLLGKTGMGTYAQKEAAWQQANARVVELIAMFYPKANVKDLYGVNGTKQPDFSIDGVKYRWQGQSGELVMYSH